MRGGTHEKLGDLQTVTEVTPLEGGACVVSVAGAFDLYSAPEFERAALEALGRGASEIVVDMSGAAFIDSTTIGILMRMRKRMLSLNGRLLLVCGDPNILKLFEVTTLDHLFEIHPSRTDALRALGVDGV